jgi:type II secretory pathway pseudopilin PulG
VNDTVRPARRPGCSAAFTVVELLVALALLAMIMTAVALAMQGAAEASAYSADKARSLTQATLALTKICTDLRRGDNIQFATAHRVSLVLPDGERRLYIWSGTPGAPLTFLIGAGASNVLVPEVLDFTLQPTNGYSEVVKAVVPVSVKVTLSVRHGQATTTLETTVRPRRSIL